MDKIITKGYIMKIIKVACLASTAASVLMLASCASIVDGTSQAITVSTAPVVGATCVLKNNKGQWRVYKTPGIVTVHRSYGDMTVNCMKIYHSPAHKIVKSTTKGMAFGNVVFGGFIGGAIDAGTGAAYDYPANILVPMT